MSVLFGISDPLPSSADPSPIQGFPRRVARDLTGRPSSPCRERRRDHPALRASRQTQPPPPPPTRCARPPLTSSAQPCRPPGSADPSPNRLFLRRVAGDL